jgi:hypothetical protein
MGEWVRYATDSGKTCHAEKHGMTNDPPRP